MKRLVGIVAVFLLALCFACSTGESGGGDSPVVPMPSPPIARGFPITVDFGRMPDGPVDGSTQVDPAGGDVNDSEFQGGGITFDGGTLRVIPPEDSQKATLPVNEPDEYAGSAEGLDFDRMPDGPVEVDGDNIEVQAGEIVIKDGVLKLISHEDFQQAAILVKELDGYGATDIEGYDAQGKLLAATTTGDPGDYYYAHLSASEPVMREIRVAGADARVRKVILASPFSITEFVQTGGLPVSAKASVIVSADFNSDGIPDVALGDSVTNQVSVLYYGPDGSVVEAETLNCDSPAIAMKTGDFDGNGYTDLAVLGEAVNIYLGYLSGISPWETYPINSYTEDMGTGDLNGDGLADIAVATRTGIYTLTGTGSDFLNPQILLLAVDARAVRLADMDGDGDTDVVVAAASPNELQVLVNDGAGNFSISGTHPLPGTPLKMDVGRFNWDEEPDAAVLMASSPNWQTFINDGGILYANQLFRATEGYAPAFEILDVNNDGFADMAIIDSDNNEVAVFTTDLAGNFIIAARWNLNGSPISLEATDWDCDWRNDLIIGDGNGNVHVYGNASR